MKNIRDFLLVFEPMSKEHPGSFVLLKANCRGPDSTQHQIGVLTGDRWTRPLNVAPQRFPMLRSNDNCAHHEVGMSVPEFRSEEHTSELQSLMRISYAVFCLKKKNKIIQQQYIKT